MAVLQAMSREILAEAPESQEAGQILGNAVAELEYRYADVAARVYGIPHITVLIKENPPENVGVNGELLVDRKP